MVNEVLPRDQLLDRAWELARELVRRPPLDAAVLASAVHQPSQAGVHRRAGPWPGPRDLRPARVLPVRRRDGAARSAMGPTAVVHRTGGQRPARRRRSHIVTSIQQRLSTGRGQVHARLPRTRHRPGELRGLHLRGVLHRRTQGRLRANWLCVGRIERLPRKGTYFTRELPGQLASIVITRDLDDNVHAFHNVCAHRGNKVVWQEHPQEESSGSSRAFACKYHGWRYGLDGGVNHITNEDEFFDLDKSKLRMPPVHCEVWAGFIFINLADDPVPLRTFLGDGLLGHGGLPLPPNDAAVRVLDPHQGQLETRRRLRLRVVPPAVRARPVHRSGRVQGREDGAASRRLPLRPVPAAHADVGPGPPPLPPREPGTARPARRPSPTRSSHRRPTRSPMPAR